MKFTRYWSRRRIKNVVHFGVSAERPSAFWETMCGAKIAIKSVLLNVDKRNKHYDTYIVPYVFPPSNKDN